MHRLDDVGILKDIQPDAEKPAWQKAAENRKKQAEGDRLKKRNAFEIEFSNIEMEGREVPAQELAEKLDTNSRELLSWLGDTKRQLSSTPTCNHRGLWRSWYLSIETEL